MGWTDPRTWVAGETHLETVFNPHVRDNFKFLKANVAWDVAVELTIAAGEITKTQSHHTVDTEGDDPTDDLDTINGCSAGELFLLRAAHTDRTVVVKHGTGNIELPNGQDYSMDNTEKAAMCFYNGSKVLVIGIVGIAPHAATHQNAGSDEIDVTDLSGLLAEAQNPLTHKASHQTGGDILYVPRTYSWFISGNVAVGTEQGHTYRMKRATIVEDVELHVKTAPVGSALIVDINEAGASLFSTRPEIDDGGTTEDNNHVFSDTALAAGAELTMDIDQVGSGTAGADLTVLLHVKEAVI